ASVGTGARQAVPVDRRLGGTAEARVGAGGGRCRGHPCDARHPAPARGHARAGAAAARKPSDTPDLPLVVGDPGTAAAGVFTTNLVVAAPVVWSRDRLAAPGDAPGGVLDSGPAKRRTRA